MVMLLELAEVKNYLRVDTNEEDGLVTRLSQSAEKLCMDVARIADAEEFAALGDTAKTAVLHHALTLTLRSLLFGVRKEGF